MLSVVAHCLLWHAVCYGTLSVMAHCLLWHTVCYGTLSWQFWFLEFMWYIWSQSESGMNSDRNQSVEEWRKKGTDSIMPDRISSSRFEQDVGKPWGASGTQNLWRRESIIYFCVNFVMRTVTLPFCTGRSLLCYRVLERHILTWRCVCVLHVLHCLTMWQVFHHSFWTVSADRCITLYFVPDYFLGLILSEVCG